MLGECTCRGKLKFFTDAKALIDIYYYVNEDDYQWKDNHGNTVKQHEYQHAVSYAEYWNAFVNKVNPYEKAYGSQESCERMLNKINDFERVIKDLADKAQSTYDKNAY